MKPWLIVTATERGPRQDNDDRVIVSHWSHECRRYYSVVVCDGIGSLVGSGGCATQTASLTMNALKDFVSSRESSRPFCVSDGSAFATQITRTIARLHGSAKHGTTVAAAVFSYRSALVAWAGDSRIYALMKDGRLNQITTDHHDAQGHIARFVRGDGLVSGGLQVRQLAMDKVVAIVGTTDGLHDSCSAEEFRDFIVYTLAGRTVDPSTLHAEVSAFLHSNIFDNTTIGLIYRPMSLRRASNILRMNGSI